MTRWNRLTAGAGAAAVVVAAGYLSAFWGRSQAFGRFPFRGEVADDDRVVALTFDDGPNEPYTSRLLDLLGERDVRATFFEVGRCVRRFPQTARRVVADGHVLGNHSYSHSFHRYLSQPAQRREIGLAQTILADVAGVRPALYRPPWLCHWPWVLHSIDAAGLTPVSGVFGHPAEIFQPPAARMADAAIRLARPGTMIIFHDGVESRGGRRDQSVAAIGPLIDRLRDDGYRFATVDELLGVPAYT